MKDDAKVEINTKELDTAKSLKKMIVYSSEENKVIIERYLHLESQVEHQYMSYLLEKRVLADIFNPNGDVIIENIIKSILLDEKDNFIEYLQDLFSYLSYGSKDLLLLLCHNKCRDILSLVYQLLRHHQPQIYVSDLTDKEEMLCSYKEIIDCFEIVLSLEKNEDTQRYFLEREVEQFKLTYNTAIENESQCSLIRLLELVVWDWFLFTEMKASRILQAPYKFTKELFATMKNINIEISDREKFDFIKILQEISLILGRGTDTKETAPEIVPK